jgi:hypothetical protein
MATRSCKTKAAVEQNMNCILDGSWWDALTVGEL